jgi:glutamate-1-semialdehyde 2,1-aminomutase
VLAPYNDTERTLELIEAHAGDLAAVIMEPMVGSGGCIRATDEFVRAVREATRRHGILLVFDEVMTSRLAPGGLHSVLGIDPDLLALGKYLGGGLTFGAFGGRADLMARFDPRRADAFVHAGTFNNNALSMAAGIAGLRDVLTPEASRRINADGDRLRERLKALLAARGVPGTVTGYGSMMMVQLADGAYARPRDTARVAPEARALCQLEMIAQGIYVSRRNMFNLSLPMADAEFDRIAAAFDAFLAEHGALLQTAP